MVNGGATGQIVDGWVLNVYAAPTVATATNYYSMAEETSSPVNFTVADSNGTVTNVTATLSTPGLATASVILSGASGTVTFTGNPDQYGTNTVSLIATDNNGFKATNTFTLAVTFSDHAPTISFIEKQNHIDRSLRRTRGFHD